MLFIQTDFIKAETKQIDTHTRGELSQHYIAKRISKTHAFRGEFYQRYTEILILLKLFQGTCIAQSIRYLPLAQVMTAESWDPAPQGEGEVNSPLSLLLSLCPSSLHVCFLSISNKKSLKTNKQIKIKINFSRLQGTKETFLNYSNEKI